jgi:hypothetical protein
VAGPPERNTVNNQTAASLDQRVHAAVRDAVAVAAQNSSAGLEVTSRFIAGAVLAEVHRLPAGQAPATGQTALRDRIAEALATAEGWTWAHGVEFKEIDTPSADDYRKLADAVLAVLPAPVDRAAVLREAAEALRRMDYDNDSNDYGYDTYRDAWNGGVMDGAGLLRRMADEAQPAQPQTGEARPGEGR